MQDEPKRPGGGGASFMAELNQKVGK